MNILSIQTGHNATVGLMQNGRVVALLSQEKLDNIKNSEVFPSQAIEAVFSQCGLVADDIDEVLIAGKMLFPRHCIAPHQVAGGEIKVSDHLRPPTIVRWTKQLEKWLSGCLPGLFAYARRYRHRALRQEALRHLQTRLTELGLGAKPLHFVEHHLCHARAAYHALEQEKGRAALVFTLDGMGDGLCATVTQVKEDGSWVRIASTPIASSLGSIYAQTTRFLGMKVLEHEYKVMGLAAYCRGYHLDTYRRIFDPVIDLDPQNPLTFRSRVDTSDFFDYLAKHAVGERFDNLAGGLQHLLEDRVTRWIANAIQMTGIRRIFTGGGTFMNVKLNQRIQEMPEVEQASFLPSCGDESNPLGAAYAHAVTLGQTVYPLSHLYLGISYTREQLARFIQERGLIEKYEVSEPEDIEETIAQLLTERQVVARFSGRCEWGARSLGNRAILAHPSYLESFYTVNDLIKARDFWMPFAPTVLDTWASRYLANYEPTKVLAPHMITAFRATSLGISHLRAAMHQGDFTIRPQVLEEKANSAYYRLLQAFERRTGVGGVMNTSFNLHGYPLVATPEQALTTFESSGLIHLALGEFLISKKQINPQAS
jgi:carbamoyltransferase